MVSGKVIRGGFVAHSAFKIAMGICIAVASLVVLTDSDLAYAANDNTPFWGSIRSEVANARVGPSTEYPIIWIYKRRFLPVKVVRVHGPWWQIEDPDGAQSWIFARLLSSNRTALVRGDVATMHENPDKGSKILWRLEPGVVGRLGECEDGWCAFDINGRAGYVAQSALWGSGEP